MFISVPILDEAGEITHKLVGLSHIAEVDFQDRRNVDAGVMLTLRNGNMVLVEETMDVFAPRLKKAWEDSVVILLHNLQIELTQGTEKARPKRKTTTRKR